MMDQYFIGWMAIAVFSGAIIGYVVRVWEGDLL